MAAVEPRVSRQVWLRTRPRPASPIDPRPVEAAVLDDSEGDDIHTMLGRHLAQMRAEGQEAHLEDEEFMADELMDLEEELEHAPLSPSQAHEEQNRVQALLDRERGEKPAASEGVARPSAEPPKDGSDKEPPSPPEGGEHSTA